MWTSIKHWPSCLVKVKWTLDSKSRHFYMYRLGALIIATQVMVKSKNMCYSNLKIIVVCLFFPYKYNITWELVQNIFSPKQSILIFESDMKGVSPYSVEFLLANLMTAFGFKDLGMCRDYITVQVWERSCMNKQYSSAKYIPYSTVRHEIDFFLNRLYSKWHTPVYGNR